MDSKQTNGQDMVQDILLPRINILIEWTTMMTTRITVVVRNQINADRRWIIRQKRLNVGTS